jgi:hypothetical protein
MHLSSGEAELSQLAGGYQLVLVVLPGGDVADDRRPAGMKSG